VKFNTSYYHDWKGRVLMDLPPKEVHDIRADFSTVLNAGTIIPAFLEYGWTEKAADRIATVKKAFTDINELTKHKCTYEELFLEDNHEVE
jgi:hypothetical protein